MLIYSYLSDQVTSMRQDRRPADGLRSFQIAAGRLAAETLGLQEIVQFTVPDGQIQTAPLVPSEDQQISLYIFKAEWQNPATGKWIPLPLYNQDAVMDLTRHTYNNPGEMKAFTSIQGNFYPNRPPAVDTLVQAVVAYRPLGDFDEVPFGPDFQDALVQGMLSHYMLLAGPDKDKQMAHEAEVKFLSMASSLRGTELIGDVGYSRASEKPRKHHFGGAMRSNMLRY